MLIGAAEDGLLLALCVDRPACDDATQLLQILRPTITY
jgi:hypothetical protein